MLSIDSMSSFRYAPDLNGFGEVEWMGNYQPTNNRNNVMSRTNAGMQQNAYNPASYGDRNQWDNQRATMNGFPQNNSKYSQV